MTFGIMPSLSLEPSITLSCESVLHLGGAGSSHGESAAEPPGDPGRYTRVAGDTWRPAPELNLMTDAKEAEEETEDESLGFEKFDASEKRALIARAEERRREAQAVAAERLSQPRCAPPSPVP